MESSISYDITLFSIANIKQGLFYKWLIISSAELGSHRKVFLFQLFHSGSQLFYLLLQPRNLAVFGLDGGFLYFQVAYIL